ncbi:MAG: MerR family DNA-binding transcriptional regulator [Acidimicrobiales bacterium]
MSPLTVSKLAELVGTSADALRYYERIGLLPEPARSASGYRLYDEAAADRVLFIKRSQRFGLRLEEIKELLEIKDVGQCPCGHTRGLLERRVAQLEVERAEIDRLHADIQQMLDQLPSAGAQEWRCGNELLQIRTNGDRSNEGGDT